MAEASVHRTVIPGLLILDLSLHGDTRGWLKENWHRATMVELGLPDFWPVQNNMSLSATAGNTCGLRAEPWDKLITLAHGHVFGAWVDLRPGPGFGTTLTLEIGVDKAVFVPRGVADGYQALEPDTVRSCLINDHWRPEELTSRRCLNLADETIAIAWPIPLAQAEISAGDHDHPRLVDITPLPPKYTVVIGAGRQLVRSLLVQWPNAIPLGRLRFGLAEPQSIVGVPWSQVGLIINASAYTDVDAAETFEGRREAWQVNVAEVRRIVEIARKHRIPFVQVSSDYVFDGTVELHTENEPFSPLGVYGQTKAAADVLVATLPRHWIVRTSRVIGDDDNFVRVMSSLADRGVNPRVVGDQLGRLTFAADLAAGIDHLVRIDAPPGTYNLTNTGATMSWADIARRVFAWRGRPTTAVIEVTTTQYFAGSAAALRPMHSTLDLTKLQATGFVPARAEDRLAQYLETEVTIFPINFLFVCTANVCRSAYLECRARQLIDTDLARFDSGGVEDHRGRPMDGHVAHLLAARGGDPSSHLSTPLTPKQLAWADVILTATASHRRALLQRRPDLARKIFTLGQFLDAIDGATYARSLARTAFDAKVPPDVTKDLVDPIGSESASIKFASIADEFLIRLRDILSRLANRPD